MDTTVKRLKANRLIEGKPCPWCNQHMAFGDDTAVCGACQTPHHAACWDAQGGCATIKCAHAPLQRIPEPAKPAALGAGMTACPHCKRPMPEHAKFCTYCKKAPTPDGLYHGPKKNAPGAAASLVYGILSLFICGVIFGFIALSKSASASKAMARDPTLGGGGMATAGKVLGIIGLVGWAILLILKVSSR